MRFAERWAWRLATLAVLMLVGVQWAMARPDVRAWLSGLDRLESVDAAALVDQVAQDDPAAVQAARPALSPVAQPQLTIVLTNAAAAPDVRLWVGDEVVGNFVRGTAFVSVRPGDVVRIDARGDRRALIFQVLRSSYLSSPTSGRIRVQGQVVALPAVNLHLSQ